MVSISVVAGVEVVGWRVRGEDGVGDFGACVIDGSYEVEGGIVPPLPVILAYAWFAILPNFCVNDRLGGGVSSFGRSAMY